MLIDTHAHVNFRSFKDDAKETLQRALDAGVWTINVGSQIDTSRHALNLAESFETGVYAVIGLHPEHTHSQFVDEEETHFKTREEDFDIKLYEELVKHPKVVGIGECGLDYYRLPKEEGRGLIEQIKQKQIEVFKKQIRFAKQHNKVLVVHSRPAKGDESLYDDLLNIFDEENKPSVIPSESAAGRRAEESFIVDKLSNLRDPSTRPDKSGFGRDDKPLRFEIHSYTGSPEYLQKFLDRGAYVSFNGIITFDKTGNMEKLVQLAPLDRILLETDCPYLTPVPNRGKRNEPAFVKYVAEKVAEIKNLSVGEISEATTGNAKKLFLI